MYNKNNFIFIDITPSYTEHEIDSANEIMSLKDKEFIKNYQPFISIKIEDDLARQWLKETEELLKIIESSDNIILNHSD